MEGAPYRDTKGDAPGKKIHGEDALGDLIRKALGTSFKAAKCQAIFGRLIRRVMENVPF